jgi:type IV secretory pathway VirD2 relaxase
MIISPEFGDRLDLTILTRELLARMERELKVELEWVAVAHFNTEHFHVHVALRGTAPDRRAIRLSREYVKNGIRSLAEDLCTRQLDHRTELDEIEAERREISETRFTTLDRRLIKQAKPLQDAVNGTLEVTVADLASRTDRERIQQSHSRHV